MRNSRRPRKRTPIGSDTLRDWKFRSARELESGAYEISLVNTLGRIGAINSRYHRVTCERVEFATYLLGGGADDILVINLLSAFCEDGQDSKGNADIAKSHCERF